jgi:hypothetical protein
MLEVKCLYKRTQYATDSTNTKVPSWSKLVHLHVMKANGEKAFAAYWIWGWVYSIASLDVLDGNLCAVEGGEVRFLRLSARGLAAVPTALLCCARNSKAEKCINVIHATQVEKDRKIYQCFGLWLNVQKRISSQNVWYPYTRAAVHWLGTAVVLTTLWLTCSITWANWWLNWGMLTSKPE